MFITSDDEFCLLWVKFHFQTIYPLLNMSKTLSELSKTGIKVPLVKCYIYIYIYGCHQHTDCGLH